MSKTICIIPARYSSSRFPGKPLALINNKPMIQWVYDGVKETRGIDGIYVATDDARIFDAVNNFDGNAIMTKVDHQSGTDRIAECVNYLGLNDDDIVLNIQGDEPLISSPLVLDLLETLKNHDVPMGTLMERISDDNDLTNENIVKVVTDSSGFALYFSRAPIPLIYKSLIFTSTFFKISSIGKSSLVSLSFLISFTLYVFLFPVSLVTIISITFSFSSLASVTSPVPLIVALEDFAVAVTVTLSKFELI